MFKCAKCKKTIGPSVSPVTVVTEKREKKYPARTPQDREGTGWEIVKEIQVCPNCK
jgi:hypothetical protein